MNYTRLIDFARQNEIRFLENELLSLHTSFKTGGACDIMLFCEDSEKIVSLVRFMNSESLPFLVLGNGTNVLAPDEGISGAVLCTSNPRAEISVTDDTVFASSGAPLTAVCNAAKNASLTGLEFAFGIPGSVGGAVYMNAGAYGGEMKDVVFESNFVTLSGEKGVIKGDGHDFSYRHSVYCDSQDKIILSCSFRLKKGNKTEIAKKMSELMNRRKDKQPLDFPSAGSTFKRPEGHFAGALIEQCGLRGYFVGGAQVSEKHCGFVINRGGATSDDILTLVKEIQTKVKSQTGITLCPEIKLLNIKTT